LNLKELYYCWRPYFYKVWITFGGEGKEDYELGRRTDGKRRRGSSGNSISSPKHTKNPNESLEFSFPGLSPFSFLGAEDDDEDGRKTA